MYEENLNNYKVISSFNNYCDLFTLVKITIRSNKMKDRLVKILLAEIARKTITKKQLEKDFPDIPKDEKFISVDFFINLIGEIDKGLESEQKSLTPKTKFLYVEDGSVELDLLESSLYETNPEIKIVVYRQGSSPPILSEGKNER